jgi:tetratricopeptide (TPR) repeat protein
VSERVREPAHGGTLPPPEWRAPRARTTSSRPPAIPQPLTRRRGVRAEEAWLRARVEETRAAGDTSALRTACSTLARWLASRDRDLDEAVDLATTALSLGADPELRREVSVWLESLGAPARAAGILRPQASIAATEALEGADIILRAGVLRARAGAGAGAASAFQTALSVDRTDPLPAELLAAVAAWDPESVSPAVAVEAYVEAARRHRLQQRSDLEHDDLWRSWATDPTSTVAVQALAGALERRGDLGASDEVWRAHATALRSLDADRSAAIHAGRTSSALASGHRSRALGAALDRALEVDLDGVEGDALETVLRDVGMPDPPGVRRELAGNLRLSALALEAIAARSPAPFRGVLFAVASDRHRHWGDRLAARSAATAAAAADFEDCRCAATLADAVLGDCDSEAATAIERAIARVGPRADWCLALADALQVLGRREPAVVWTQRHATLRPGDRKAVNTLLDRVLATGDAGHLVHALTWLLSQPLPLDFVGVKFSVGMRELARVDIGRAVVLARRALDVFGPKSSTLRDAMLEVAHRAHDDAFAAAVLERWLAYGAEGGDRRSLLVRLADVRERLGDDEGVARIVARAVREGFNSPEMDAHLARLAQRPATADAQLWRMGAEASRKTADRPGPEAAAAWRELGGALWDLAADRVGAIGAWRRAARMAGPGGHTVLALDVIAFGGTPFGLEYLERLVEAEVDDATAAGIAVEAGSAALWSGEPRAALMLSARSIGRYPRQGGAFEVAEPAARRCGEYGALSDLYDTVAVRALGRFGRRAAHYRGAQFFERLGEPALALKHAVQAFHAMPSEGSTLQLLARTAARAGDGAQAVRAIERVAEDVSHGERRAAWWIRAANMAGAGEEAARSRVDLLLRAVIACPRPATIASLRDAALGLLAVDPEERDPLQMRLARAARTATDGTAGPEAARVAIAFALLALELFGDADGALSCVEKAIACDGDADGFAPLVGWATTLAGAAGSAERVTAMIARAEQPGSNVGEAAHGLLATVAASIRDEALRPRVAGPSEAGDLGDSLAATGDGGESDANVEPRASLAPREGAPSLKTRGDRWMEVAARREGRGDARGALKAALEACKLDPEPLERWTSIERLAELAGDEAARIRGLEQLAQRVEPEHRSNVLHRLAHALAGTDDFAAAIRVWRDVLAIDPDDEGAHDALERTMAAGGRYAELAEHLARRAEALDAQSPRRAEIELEAGYAWLESGNAAAAMDLARRMIALRPGGRAGLELGVEAASAADDKVALGDALVSLAMAEDQEPSARGDLLVEAAMISARAGDLNGALDRARAAAQASPDRATPQLLARGLEYRFRGSGAPDEARRTIADLEGIAERLMPDDAALRAFLLAEALDAVQGGGAGLRELQAAEMSIGPHPLVAVGLAERFVGRGDLVAAIGAYRVAISGPLLDLRKSRRVALSAADAAIRANRPADAAMFVEAADRYDEARTGASGRSLVAHADVRISESVLWEELQAGATAAGDRLAEALETSPDRTRDLVRVRYRQVSIEPGDVRRLELLHHAALADGDLPYARAVQHVMRAFDVVQGPLPPPPLSTQPEQPGVFALLTRPSSSPSGEALALLWDEAKQLFARDPDSYGVRDIERVVPSPASTIARIYQAAIRVLDAPRIPLFFRPATGDPSAKVVVTAQPSVLLTGDAHDETVALLFELGRGISAALPQNVICLGLPASEARAAVAALGAAFGVTFDRDVTSHAALLAESFWQLVPARSQRRLQQLLGTGPLPEYEELVAQAMHVGRRVAMFLAGDFGYAARDLLAHDPSRSSQNPTLYDLRALCEGEPLMADLFRLAISPEYAQARWHVAPADATDGKRPQGALDSG